jgi:hypothetical protein
MRKSPATEGLWKKALMSIGGVGGCGGGGLGEGGGFGEGGGLGGRCVCPAQSRSQIHTASSW